MNTPPDGKLAEPVHLELSPPSHIWTRNEAVSSPTIPTTMTNSILVWSGYDPTQPSLHKRECLVDSLPCPYGHKNRVFQGIDQLLAHTRTEHRTEIDNMDDKRARLALGNALSKYRNLDRLPGALTEDDTTCAVGSLGVNRTTKHKNNAKAKSRGNVSVFSPRSTTQKTAYGKNDIRSRERYIYDDNKKDEDATFPSTFLVQQLPNRFPVAMIQKYDSRYPGLLLQPDSQPVLQEQLISEVKSIYAGLTMVETKCIHVDGAQAKIPHDPEQKLAPDHWQALIALHRTLLHEHHDFFLASQHPSASPALRGLAVKYTMPARMWKHGVHSFLELLRQRLPQSLDYMLAFVHLAYQMFVLLYETVPVFEKTWTECLGDLGRYRMAIEDNIRPKKRWAGVARSWYTKAADLSPATGRLYHHLAILALDDHSAKLYYFARCMTSLDPFLWVRESILTLFDPFVSNGPDGNDPIERPWKPSLPLEEQFVILHAYQFIMLRKEGLGRSFGCKYRELFKLFNNNDSVPKFEQISSTWIGSMDSHIEETAEKWKENGVHFAVGNISAWFSYGSVNNALRQLFLWRRTPEFILPEDSGPGEPPSSDLTKPSMSAKRVSAEMQKLLLDPYLLIARQLTNKVFAVVLHRIGDKNVLTHVHVLLGFISTLASHSQTLPLITSSPWSELAAFLDELIESTKMSVQGIAATMKGPLFTKEESNCDEHKHRQYDEQPLPEDYLMQGLVWAVHYFPEDWFDNGPDEEERTLELASTSKLRIMRILRLAYGLSLLGHWISFNEDTARFSAQPQVDPQLLRNEQVRWVTDANQERGKDGQSLSTTSKKRVAVVAYLKRSLSSPRPLNDRWQSFVKEKLEDMDVMFVEQAGETSEQGLVHTPGWMTRNAIEEADVIVVVDNGWIPRPADAEKPWVDSGLNGEWAKTAQKYVDKMGNKVVLWNWADCRCEPLRHNNPCGKCCLDREGRLRFARTATEMRGKVTEVALK